MLKLVPAHPRSRGEHDRYKVLGGNVQGSSPLTRGALINVEHAKAHVGLIPAHAGSTDDAAPQP